MHNPVIGISHFGKVYKRKIHIYFRNQLTNGEWRYCYSSNAYITCRDAVIAAKTDFPNSEVHARFAKD